MIEVLTDRLTASVVLDGFVVCTTISPADDPIEDFCTGRGYPVHRGSVNDVLGRFVAASATMPSDYVARITGDNPFTDLDDTLPASLARLERQGTDYSRPVGVPLGTAAEVIRTAKLVELDARTRSHELTEYMTYFFEMAPFIAADLYEVREELRFPELRLTVDYESDLAFAERLLDHFGGRVPPLAEIVAYARTLDEFPRVSEDAGGADEIRNRIAFD